MPTNKTEKKGHLVVSVPGGPLSFLYGTPSASPELVRAEIRHMFEKSKAGSLELICVDPHTDAPYTKDLDPHEAGFKKPDYRGTGWNAKLYSQNQDSRIIAGMHQYCGSGSTNLNNGRWQRDTDERHVDSAIEAIKKTFPGREVILKTYSKSERSGEVDERLQKLTKTPYSAKLR